MAGKINVRQLMEPREGSSPPKIVRVTKDQPHTLVVRQGGASACLRFEEEIVAEQLLLYCDTRLGWQVRGLPFVVNGQRYTADQAKTIALAPSTERVDVGQVPKPAVLEVTRNVGSKG